MKGTTFWFFCSFQLPLRLILCEWVLLHEWVIWGVIICWIVAITEFLLGSSIFLFLHFLFFVCVGYLLYSAGNWKEQHWINIHPMTWSFDFRWSSMHDFSLFPSLLHKDKWHLIHHHTLFFGFSECCQQIKHPLWN